MSKIIYMDNAATTPMKDVAYETIKCASYSRFYNPSSPYAGARENRRALENCRCQIAEMINADPTEIYFTSGGTESDNWALRGMGLKVGDNLVTTMVEHDAIYNTAEDISINGIEIRYVSPNKDGLISSEDILSRVDEHTKLVSMMTINNETGVRQPIELVGRELKKLGTFFHTDAVQAVGHIPIDIDRMRVDMLSASAHKFGGPKGIGFLFARKMTQLKGIITGGHQERGMRAGTENLPSIMGMTAALKESVKNMEQNYEKIHDVTTYFMGRILYDIPDVIYNGSDTSYYPGIMNFSFKGVPGEQLVEFLNENKICVSSGSACNTDSDLPSRVLISMGRTEEEANCAIRFSLNENNTMEEAARVVEVVKKGVELIRD